MNRTYVKLTASHGPDEQQIVVKRQSDLNLRDLMEDLQNIYRIPIEEVSKNFK